MKNKDLLKKLYQIQALKTTAKYKIQMAFDKLQSATDALHELETSVYLLIQELNSKKRGTK